MFPHLRCLHYAKQPMVQCEFHQNPNICRNMKIYPKIHKESLGTPNIQNNFKEKKKKEQSGMHHKPQSQNLLKNNGNQNSVVLAKRQIYKPTDWNREPRNQPSHIWSNVMHIYYSFKN